MLINFYLRNSISKGSQTTYGSHFRQYLRFCEERRLDVWMTGLGPSEQEDRVLEFLGHQRLVRKNLAGTLRGKKSALAYEFKRRNLGDPTRGLRVSMLLRALTLADGDRTRRKWPVARRHLLSARYMIDRSTKKGSALWLSLLLGWFFLLRSRNFASPGAASDYDENYILQRGDIRLFDENDKAVVISGKALTSAGGAASKKVAGLEIHVRISKNDQMRVGFKRKLYRSGDGELCVVQSYLDHMRATPTLEPLAPVCAYEEKGTDEPEDLWACITRKEITGILRQVVKELGENEADFASHSLRVGGATAMRAAGFSDSFIKWWGTWKTFSFLTYLANTEQEVAEVAHRMSKVDAIVYARD